MADAVVLSDEMLGAILDAEPVAATLLGLRDRDDRLPDYSEAGDDAVAARVRDIARRAGALDSAALGEDDRVTRAVVMEQAEGMLRQIESRAVEYTLVDAFFMPAIGLITMLPMVTLVEQAHADGYLSRLAAMPDVLAAIAERHRIGIAAGRLPVRKLAQATVEHLDRYLADPENDPLRRPTLSGDGQGAFVAGRDRVLSDIVHPALTRYRDTLAADVVPHGRPEDRPGLCFLPDGEAIYAGLVRAHTTTDRSPEELHQTGLDIMSRLAEEYVEIGSKVFGTRDVAEVLNRLRGDPSLRWSSGEELLAAAREAIMRAEEAAPQWFGKLPSQQCTVEPVPEGEAPGAAGAYYLPPALDGTRPGIYFANTYKVEERDRYTSEATAFHEAVPGHHFQLTLAQELVDLPMLRRLAPFNAYAEGWGLYSERLADEMGLYSNDVARLGMVTADSMRAARLVVDTGLHAKGWTRQQVVDYLSANTAMSPIEIESETDRYIAAPGQALAYMVGRLEIQRVRAEAERALGDRFDIRSFHDAVLGNGPLPLRVLDEVVRSWVATAS